MKKTALLLCLLLASIHARADLVIVQNVDSKGANHDVTIKIKGDHFRTDIADQISSITNLTNGDTMTLVHSRKAYMSMSGTEMVGMIQKKMQAALQGQPAPTAADEPKIVDTGKNEKVGGYKAEIYTSQSKLMKFTYWVTKDYANYAVVNAQMQNFKERQAALSDKMSARNYLVPDTSKINGVVLKTEMVDSQGATSTMTLVSAKAETLDDALFQAPADYTQIQQPPAPGAAPAAATAPAPAGAPAK